MQWTVNGNDRSLTLFPHYMKDSWNDSRVLLYEHILLYAGYMNERDAVALPHLASFKIEMLPALETDRTEEWEIFYVKTTKTLDRVIVRNSALSSIERYDNVMSFTYILYNSCVEGEISMKRKLIFIT